MNCFCKLTSLSILICVILGGCSQNIEWVKLQAITSSTALYVHNDRLYVVDEEALIRVYDTNGFQSLFTFGGRGDGPGEFQLRPDHSINLFFMKDRILINSDGKLGYFSFDGQFLYEKQTPGRTRRYRPLGKDRLVYRGHAESGDSLFYTYMLCDTVFQDIKEITREKNDYQPIGPTIDVFAMSWDFYTNGDRVYIHDRSKGQVIDVYGRDGNPIRSIQDAYEPVKVEQKHIDGVHAQYSTSPYSKDEYGKWLKDALRFPDYFPAIRTWVIADERIYIFSFKEKDSKSQLRIYSDEGDFLSECYVILNQKNTDIDRVAPFAVDDSKLYQFVKSETNDWRLKIINLDSF